MPSDVRERVRRVRAGEPLDAVYEKILKRFRLGEYVRDLEAIADAVLRGEAVAGSPGGA